MFRDSATHRHWEELPSNMCEVDPYRRLRSPTCALDLYTSVLNASSQVAHTTFGRRMQGQERDTVVCSSRRTVGHPHSDLHRGQRALRGPPRSVGSDLPAASLFSNSLFRI